MLALTVRLWSDAMLELFAKEVLPKVRRAA
jgi:hypothetical protein